MAEQGQLDLDSRRTLRVRLLVWASIVVLGLSRLFFPLGGDQALFLGYAQGMDEGARLYVDLWDVKQPGIFWFYLAAGRLFGFNPVGIHLLEWFWLSAGGLLLWKAARLSFRSALSTELVPLLTVGIYYWWAGVSYLSQVEILVMLPLAGCVLAGVVALRRPSSVGAMHFAFGACAGVVAVFKLVLFLVPSVIWIVLCILSLRTIQSPKPRFWLGMLLPAALGAAFPLGAVAGHFLLDGSWDVFYWANFVYPREAIAQYESKEIWHLFLGARWLLLLALPPTVLAIVRPGLLRSRPCNAIEALALGWLAAGAFAIVLQKFSWWSYHFLLLLPPVGLLTAALIDRYADDTTEAPARTAGRMRRDRWVAAMLVALMFLLVPLHSARAVAASVAAAKAASGDRLVAFRTVLDTRYRERIEESAFLRDAGLPEAPIYVFGSPIWLLEAHRKQALPIHGWAWEIMLDEQWAALPGQLREHRPAFIYVDAAYRPDIAKRAPEAAALIARDYVSVARTSEDGIWYRLKDSTREVQSEVQSEE